jgi:hypothetical protein
VSAQQRACARYIFRRVQIQKSVAVRIVASQHGFFDEDGV